MSVASLSRPVYVYGPGLYSPEMLYVAFRYVKRRLVDKLACRVIARSEVITSTTYIDVSSYPLNQSASFYAWLSFVSMPPLIQVGFDDAVYDVDRELDYAVDPYHAYVIIAYGSPGATLSIYAFDTLIASVTLQDPNNDGKAMDVIVVEPGQSFTMKVVPSNCRFTLLAVPKFEYHSSLTTLVLACTELKGAVPPYTEVETLFSSISKPSMRLVPKPAAVIELVSWVSG